MNTNDSFTEHKTNKVEKMTEEKKEKIIVKINWNESQLFGKREKAQFTLEISSSHTHAHTHTNRL